MAPAVSKAKSSKLKAKTAKVAEASAKLGDVDPARGETPWRSSTGRNRRAKSGFARSGRTAAHDATIIDRSKRRLCRRDESPSGSPSGLRMGSNVKTLRSQAKRITSRQSLLHEPDKTSRWDHSDCC